MAQEMKEKRVEAFIVVRSKRALRWDVIIEGSALPISGASLFRHVFGRLQTNITFGGVKSTDFILQQKLALAMPY